MGLFGNKNKNNANYISAKESRRISKENRKITAEIEKKRNRKNIPKEEYITKMKNPNNVVEFDNVHTYFFTDIGVVKAVDGVSFEVPKGKTVGIVGESGCGKSVTSLSMMQLVQRPTGQTVEGEIRFDAGDQVYNVVNTPTSEMQKLRGNQMAMIFQEPMTSLNPVFRIGDQVDEVIALHNPSMSKEEVKERTIEMLKMVGIANSEGVYSMYPHELSGGMRQRIMIAMALICNPKVLFADEPTTALDVTIQAQIIELMNDLKDKIDTSIVLITHDMGVVANMADRIYVMYAGQIVEHGDCDTIFHHPKHPYTWGLLSSVPRLDKRVSEDLYSIPGTPPDLLAPPVGCAFAARCKYAMNICRTSQPPCIDFSEPDHYASCWLNHPECIKRNGAPKSPVEAQNIKEEN